MPAKTSNFTPLILTLDDDQDFNNLMHHTLEKIKAKSETFTDTKKFIQRVESSSPSLVIIDLNLGLNFGEGFSVIRRVRELKGEGLPIFVLSRRSSQQDISNAFELGASDYITKPLDEIILLSKIKQFIIIRDGKFISPSEEQEDFTLRYKTISENHSPCKIKFDLHMSEISEFGITLVGKHFLARGTSVLLDSPLLQEITGVDRVISMTVHNNWIDHDTGQCGSFLEFNAHNDLLMTSVRKWLSKNRTKYPLVDPQAER